MAYATGNPATLKAVITALAAFLPTVAGGGWTVDYSAADRIAFHNGNGSYFRILWQVGGGGPYYETFSCYGGTAHAGGGALTNASPAVGVVMSATSAFNPPTLAPSAYFFFADANALFVVVAVAANDYQVIAFQSVSKIGTWPGGAAGDATFVAAYADGRDPGSFDGDCWFRDTGSSTAVLRCNGAWKVLGADFGMLQGGAGNQPDYTPFLNCYRGDIDGRVGLPYAIWINDGAGNSWPAGTLRRCSYMHKTGLSPRQIIQIGAVNYMVFPGQHATEGSNARIALVKD